MSDQNNSKVSSYYTKFLLNNEPIENCLNGSDLNYIIIEYKPPKMEKSYILERNQKISDDFILYSYHFYFDKEIGNQPN